MIPQLLDFAQRVASTAAWTLIGVLIFYLGARIYDRLDPIDYEAEIKSGNVAAALRVSAVTLGLAAIVVAAILG